jgi:hypothetical protein
LLPEYAACRLETAGELREPELGALHDLLCALKPDEKALLVLRVVMSAGVDYRVMKGKMWQRDRRHVGIPLGMHWRILLVRVGGKWISREALSHADYDHR